MRERAAILLDGGFVSKKLAARLGRFPTAPDVHELIGRILAHPGLAGRELLRAFYYDAPPLAETVPHPLGGSRLDFAANRVYGQNRELQRGLALSSNVALRQGELVFRGWKLRSTSLSELLRAPRGLEREDLAPEVEEKGVDLRIGLDVASLAVKRIVDTIVLVSGDSDLVPAMKFARREGVRVYLGTLGHRVRRSMREHADVVLDGSSDAPLGE